MAYDYFENTSFDLNQDGHIDSSEAAYIYDTFFNNDAEGELNDEIYESHKPDYSFSASLNAFGDKNKTDSAIKSIDESKCKKSSKGLIAWGIIVLLAILFPDSLAVAIFVGVIFLSLKISDSF